MERKYYLRGLGLGIAVTAIIMGIALSGDKTMTNDEIIARAKELGMVENTVLSNDSGNEAENADEEPIDEAKAANQQQEIEETVQDTAREDVTEIDNEESDEEEDALTEGETEDQTPDDSEAEEPEAEPEDVSETEEPPVEEDNEAEDNTPEDVGESITTPTIKSITINSGDGSYTVARKLADVGVVSSAANFDTFLCQHGYDKRLRTGTFSIPSDASDEQIARIVTGME